RNHATDPTVTRDEALHLGGGVEIFLLDANHREASYQSRAFMYLWRWLRGVKAASRPPTAQPPVMGGNRATSSPGRTGSAGRANSWLTATRTTDRSASAASWP